MGMIYISKLSTSMDLSILMVSILAILVFLCCGEFVKISNSHTKAK